MNEIINLSFNLIDYSLKNYEYSFHEDKKINPLRLILSNGNDEKIMEFWCLEYFYIFYEGILKTFQVTHKSFQEKNYKNRYPEQNYDSFKCYQFLGLNEEIVLEVLCKNFKIINELHCG